MAPGDLPLHLGVHALHFGCSFSSGRPDFSAPLQGGFDEGVKDKLSQTGINFGVDEELGELVGFGGSLLQQVLFVMETGSPLVAGLDS